MPRHRLDAELVRRGLAPDRAAAAAVVAAGGVRVAGMPVTNAASLVGEDVALHVVEHDGPRLASRGGEKLAAALDRFALDVAGWWCVDVGASAGGFTDVLLRRGAAHVVAVDVGYGQLAWHLRTDPRVEVRERTNARSLTAASLAPAPDLIVGDLSFVSLRSVLPVLAGLGAPNLVLLVKPQFEAPSTAVGPGGVVRDPEVWRSAVAGVLDQGLELGLAARGAIASPLRGPAGNVEFLVWLGPDGGGAVDLDAAIAEALVVSA